MNSKSRRHERGSTLIESLVALTLFATGAAAIGNLLVADIRMQGWNVTQTTAIELAQRELEDLRSLAYGAIVSRTNSQTVGGMTYTVVTNVTDDTPDVNMKSITTTVNWPDPNGPQTYSLSAIYAPIMH